MASWTDISDRDPTHKVSYQDINEIKDNAIHLYDDIDVQHAIATGAHDFNTSSGLEYNSGLGIDLTSDSGLEFQGGKLAVRPYFDAFADGTNGTHETVEDAVDDGCVSILVGQTTETGAFTLPANCMLQGAGPYVSKITMGGIITLGDRSTIRDLQFYSANSSYYLGSYNGTGQYSLLKNCAIINNQASGKGFYVVGEDGLQIINCYFYLSSTSYAIQFVTTASSKHKIIGNYFRTCSYALIDSVGCPDSIFANNLIESYYDNGVLIHASADHWIIFGNKSSNGQSANAYHVDGNNNVIVDNRTSGFTSGDAAEMDGDENLLGGNLFDDADIGIDMNGDDSLMVTNHLYGCTTPISDTGSGNDDTNNLKV